MRLIKCSATDPELADENMMRMFFEKTLPKDKTFNFNGKIGEDALYEGETLLFQYGARLRYIGKAASNRESNPPGSDYEYHFLVDPSSLYRTEEIHFLELQRLLEVADIRKPLGGQAWTIIPDSDAAYQIIEKLKTQKIFVPDGEQDGNSDADENDDDNLNEIEKDMLALSAGKLTGQRFQRNIEKRNATELKAMEMAQAHFSQTWDVVENVSAGRPYDLHCLTEDGRELRVEVKGTTGDGSSVFLTRGEVENALQFEVALYVVTFIKLLDTSEGIKAEGGVPVIYNPWKLNHEQLTALSYKYSVGERRDGENCC